MSDTTFEFMLTELTNMCWHAGKDDGRFNLDLDYCVARKAVLNYVHRLEDENNRLRGVIVAQNS